MARHSFSNTTRPNTTRFEGFAYVALRIVAGAMFLLHGTQKLFGFPTGPHPAVGSQLWVGGIIEAVTGLFIALGLLVRPAAFLAAGTMAVAYFQFHYRMGEAPFLPLVNKGELAVLYCFVFLFMCARGAGACSLDSLRRR